MITREEISELLGCGPVGFADTYIWRDRRCTVAFGAGDGAYCTVPSIHPDPDWQVVLSTIDELREWAKRVGWHEEVMR